MDTLIIGLLLGATYCLMALGLTLQYGVARIMNLAGGEWIVVGGFAAYWSFALQGVSPLWGFALAVPFAFVLNWLIYQYLLTPLIRRAKTRGALEVDSILATFGMSFIAVGLMRMAFGGEFFNYSFLAEPVLIFGSAFGLNRIFAAAVAIVFGVALYFWLVRSRTGMAMRALALSPSSAKLVAIDVQKLSLIAFSVGGAMSAAGGVVLSTFLTLDASVGGGLHHEGAHYCDHGRRWQPQGRDCRRAALGNDRERDRNLGRPRTDPSSGLLVICGCPIGQT